MSGRAARASRARKREEAIWAEMVAVAEDFRRTRWELRDRAGNIYIIATKPLPTGSLRWGGKLHYFDSVLGNGALTQEGA